MFQINHPIGRLRIKPRVDLSRQVYGIFGIPFDVVELSNVVQKVHEAADMNVPFLLSTPNVHFLIYSKANETFRASLLQSDLCPIDGMPIVWIARLLGMSISERVSGADIFNALKDRRSEQRSIFLFGGVGETAVRVGEKLNSDHAGLRCVGAHNPGFGSIEDLSQHDVVDRVNASKADILGVFLSAQKGQSWLLHNHDRLTVPVRAQLGATINFEAGSVKRAPFLMRKWGLEWIWRIREEPALWQRYWSDGLSFLLFLAMSALPLACYQKWQAWRAPADATLTATTVDGLDETQVHLAGYATENHIQVAIAEFEDALDAGRPLTINFSAVRAIDVRLFGLLLAIRKELVRRGQRMTVCQLSPSLVRVFRLNGFGFLLSPNG